MRKPSRAPEQSRESCLQFPSSSSPSLLQRIQAVAFPGSLSQCSPAFPSWKEAAPLSLVPGGVQVLPPKLGPGHARLLLPTNMPASSCRLPVCQRPGTLLQWRTATIQSSPDVPPPSWAEIWLPQSEQPLDSLKHTAAWPPFSLTLCQNYYTVSVSVRAARDWKNYDFHLASVAA